MKIKRLKLKNFRQYKDVVLDFDGSPERNVVIILGDNGYGKTTLVRSFIWCLYGTTKGFRAFNLDRYLMNKDVAREMRVGSTATTTVVLEFDHNGNSYEVTTSERYKKKDKDSIEIDKSVTTKLRKDNFKENVCLEIENPEQVRIEIESILGNEIKDYFFYDGENNKIEQIGDRKKLKNVISDMMGISRIESLNKYFNPDLGVSVEAMLTNKKSDINDLELDDLLEESEKKKSDLNKCENDIKNVQNEISNLEEQIQAKEDIVIANNEVRQFQEDLKICEKKKSELENRINESFDHTLKLFDGSHGKNKVDKTHNAFLQILYGYAFKKFDLQSLENESSFNSGTSLSNISEEAVEQLITRGYCLCGRKIETGSDAYNHLMEAKSHMEPHDYGKYISDFITSESLNANAASELEENIKDSCKHYSDLINEYGENQNAIEKYENKLRGRLDVGKIAEELEGIKRQKCMKEGELRVLVTQNLPNIKRELDVIRKKINRLYIEKNGDILIDRAIAYSDYIFDLTTVKIKEKKEKVRSELEKNVNFLFKKMYHGDRTLQIDDNYNVTSFLDEQLLENSTGIETVKNYAFIGALVCVARELLLEDLYPNELANTVDYPLVMDAPFSNTDEEHIKNIGKEISSFCDQLIIVIMEKDFRIAESVLKDKIGKIYEIVKHSETYDTIKMVKNYV